MITKDMTIGQVIREHPESIPVFLKNGLTCIGCPMASMESLEQGALSHGIDLEKMLLELNDGKNKEPKAKQNAVKKK